MAFHVEDQPVDSDLGNQAMALFVVGSKAEGYMMNEDIPNSHTQSWTAMELEFASVPVSTTDDFAADIPSIKSHHADSCYLFVD